MNEILTTNQLKMLLEEINSDDLKIMFNHSLSPLIIKNFQPETIQNKLFEYYSYKIPVSLGDIVEMNNKTYTVTCIYTDNSVDLLSENCKKSNIGLYKVNLSVVGKLQCITV